MEGVGLGQASEVSEGGETSVRHNGLGSCLASRRSIGNDDLASVGVGFIKLALEEESSGRGGRGSGTTDTTAFVDDVGNVASNGGLVEERETALLDDGARREAVSNELNHKESARVGELRKVKGLKVDSLGSLVISEDALLSRQQALKVEV